MTKAHLQAEIRHFLKQQPDFNNLTNAEIYRLSQKMSYKKIKKGQWLFDQADVFEYVFFLKKGYVKLLLINEDGQPNYMSFLMPPTMFPLRGVLKGKSYYYNAVAKSDLEVYYLSIHELRKVIINNYAFTMTFIQRMEQMIHHSEKNLSRIACSTPTQRVRQVLNGLNQDYAQNRGEFSQIPFPILLKDLAVLSGTTSETAGTVVKELKEANQLMYNKKMISFI